jgi:hypothetical protein
MSSSCQVTRRDVHDMLDFLDSTLDEDLEEACLAGGLHWDSREELMDKACTIIWETYDKMKRGGLEDRGACPFQEEIVGRIEQVLLEHSGDPRMYGIRHMVQPCQHHRLKNLFSFLTII